MVRKCVSEDVIFVLQSQELGTIHANMYVKRFQEKNMVQRRSCGWIPVIGVRVPGSMSLQRCKEGHNHIGKWFPKYDFWADIICILWELPRNVNFQSDLDLPSEKFWW